MDDAYLDEYNEKAPRKYSVWQLILWKTDIKSQEQ